MIKNLISVITSGDIEINEAIVILISGQSNPMGTFDYNDLPAEYKTVLTGRKIYFHSSDLTQINGIDSSNENNFRWVDMSQIYSRVVYNSNRNKAGIEYYLFDEFYNNRNVYILKYTRSGTELNRWDLGDPSEHLYTESINYFNRGLADIKEPYELGFMHFDQGESGGLTETRLNAVIAQYRGVYPDLKWIQRKLSVNQTNVDSGIMNTARAAVDAIDISDPLFKKVDSDDVVFPDDLHYDNAGAATIAQRVYDAYNSF